MRVIKLQSTSCVCAWPKRITVGRGWNESRRCSTCSGLRKTLRNRFWLATKQRSVRMDNACKKTGTRTDFHNTSKKIHKLATYQLRASSIWGHRHQNSWPGALPLWVSRYEKGKPVWVQMRREMIRFGDVGASDGPYANNPHLVPDR